MSTDVLDVIILVKYRALNTVTELISGSNRNATTILTKQS